VSSSFEFDGYKLRDATDRDEDLAQAWTRADEYHRDLDGRFWLEKGQGTETFVCEGADGEPLFFLRLDKAVRIRIQFRPRPEGMDEREHRAIVRQALTRGMAFLDVTLSVRHFREVIFDSVSPLLRAFTIGRLRFTRKPDTLTRMLPSFALKRTAQRNTLQTENH